MTNNSPPPSVFVVDDDDAMRQSIQWLMESVGLPVQMFSSALEFLQACDPRCQGCLLLDVRMPGMSGMDLLERLKSDGFQLPVIIITGHGDVPMAVRALKHGAFDFIQKPFNSQELLDQVNTALQQDSANRREYREFEILHSQFATLTGREREIVELVVTGDSSKVIAAKLGISPKTVDIHRANIMRKINVHTIAELVQSRLALKDF